MATKVMPKAITEADSDLARLGVGAYASKVSPTHVDLPMPPATPVLATISAEPQNITIDLKRSAMIVVDMQNDFCAPGGWVDWLGADLTPERAPIPHLQRLLPALRTTGVPIIWLNSGNRADRKNLPPTTLMFSVATASASAANYRAMAHICPSRTAGQQQWSTNSCNLSKISRLTNIASAAVGTRRWIASSNRRSSEIVTLQ